MRPDNRPRADRADSEVPALYGRHAVVEAIKSGEAIEKIFLLQTRERNEPLAQIRRAAEAEGIPVLFAPREKLEKLSGSRDHQGVVALVSAHDYASADDVIDVAAISGRPLLVLDHVEDPQNLGSLLRTGDSAGIAGVIIPKRGAAGLTAGAAKASAGAIQHVKVARVPNLHQTLLALKKRDFTLVGAHREGENYREIAYPRPLAIVLGNEHKGLGFLIKNTCDTLASIPMKGHLDSLNVSVAGALLIYEAFFRREKSSAGRNLEPL